MTKEATPKDFEAEALALVEKWARDGSLGAKRTPAGTAVFLASGPVAAALREAYAEALASKDATIERLQDEVVNLSSIVATGIDDVAGAALDDAEATIERLEGERDDLHKRVYLAETNRDDWRARAEAAEAALDDAVKALEQGFMTGNSDGQNARYEVVIKFRDLRSMQAAHGALVNLARSRTGGANG